jgi:hypothetical protein
MITVTKKQLQLLSSYCDTNNINYRFNYIFIDSDNIVATDTRALIVMEHLQDVDKEFAIHKSVIELALKTNATEYILKENSICCVLKKYRDEVCISATAMSDFEYVNYKRITDIQDQSELKFVSSDAISGMLQMKNIAINDKYIPKLRDYGYLRFVDNSRPIEIDFVEHSTKIFIMPMSDLFQDFFGEREPNHA